MCFCDLKTLMEIIQAVITSIGIFLGGCWVLYLFLTQRENQPRIEMRADIIFHKLIGDYWIVELIAYVENKGKVQHKLYNFEFDLASINTGQIVEVAEQFGGQALFPNPIAQGSFLREDMQYFFIEPGVKGKYSYLARVPANAEAIVLHAWFNYDDINRVHGAEKTAVVPGQNNDPNLYTITRVEE